ncbi:MAG: hypothetical protein JWR61_1344 [Ferruginibacter sp.]|nr:hypothetical protein [Ferruginibacter sp.]
MKCLFLRLGSWHAKRGWLRIYDCFRGWCQRFNHQGCAPPLCSKMK